MHRVSNMRALYTSLFIAGACFFAPHIVADSGSVNGTWVLNEEESTTFKEAGKALNKKIKNRNIKKHKQEFDRSSGTSTNKAGGMFEKAAAASKMIAEDQRQPDWSTVDEILEMIAAESIKLYSSRKVAILYGEGRKRLLAVNPSGRSFSVSGTTVTQDDIGISLTYVENGVLVIETDTRWRDKLIEQFVLDDTFEQLLVTIKLQQVGTGPWLEFVRVFDRAK